MEEMFDPHWTQQFEAAEAKSRVCFSTDADKQRTGELQRTDCRPS